MFLQIPFPFSNIFAANLLNTIWCSLGFYFFIISVSIVLEKSTFIVMARKNPPKEKTDFSITNINKLQVIFPSLAAGLTLAFSKTYWLQSTSVEVYSLQIFLFTLILFSVIKAYYSDKKGISNWLFVGFAFALGFSNHMTTILALPTAAILFFVKEKFSTNSFKKILIVCSLSIPLMLLIYLYLPLRASTNPEINWGNPINLENLWRHFTGKQYQVWLFSSVDSAKRQLAYFVKNLGNEFAYFPLLIFALGFAYVYKQNKIIFACLTTTFVFATLYTINYDIVDIDSYFLLPYLMLAFFSAFGYQKVSNILLKKSNNISYTFAIILFLAIIPLVINYSKINQSDKYIFEDYTKAILNSVDKNSIILSYQWDYFISPSYYFQFVENYRNDVAVIDKELLRRSWYYNQLSKNYPGIVERIKNEKNNFVNSVIPFEQEERYDPILLENNYRTLMTNLVAKNVETVGFYIGLELLQNEMQKGEFSLPDGYNIIPDLLLFKVVKGSEYVPANDPNFILRFPKYGDKYVDFIERTVGVMLISRAAYEVKFGKIDRAKIYLNKVLKDLKNVRIPDELYQQVFK